MVKNILFKLLAIFTVSISLIFVCMEEMNILYAESNTLYDFDEIITPVWQGNIIYDESVLVVSEKDGNIKPIQLLYDIDEIISVKSADYTKTYINGTDYELNNGKLIVIKTGNIPVLDYNEFHPTTGTTGFESRDGGYVLWKEGSYYHSKQIIITYKHSDSFDGTIPVAKGSILPKTQQKLKDKKPVSILFYGDSITTGANSSGHSMINVSPYLPIFPKMLVNRLKQIYQYQNITMINKAVGGTDSSWGVSNIRNNFDSISPDLVVLGFGMNDINTVPETFKANISKMISGIRRYSPDAEFIIISTMLPNYDAVKFYGYQEQFIDVLMDLEDSGIAVADMTTMHQNLLNRKNYADMTGNNVNHPNDFLARVYAQVLTRTIEESSEYVLPGQQDDEQEDEDDGLSKKGCNSKSAVSIALILLGYTITRFILSRK